VYTTRLFLLCHAHVDEVGAPPAGGAVDPRLSPRGARDALWLGERLETERIDRLYTSPLPCAAETAALLGRSLALPFEIVEELSALDRGEESSASASVLGACDATRAPDGGSRPATWAPVVAFLDRLHEDGAEDQGIVVVTHADVLRAAILCYLGSSLDAIPRIRIDPGSLCLVVRTGEQGPCLHYVNVTRETTTPWDRST
jgi:probable phosphoglycerate mutase